MPAEAKPGTVLAVATVRRAGGAEVVLLRMLRRLAERGWRVRLATPGPGPLRVAAEEAGFAATGPVPVGRMARGSVAALGGALALAKLARRERADVLLLNGRLTQRLVPGAALARKPVVLFLHDVMGPGDASRLWGRRWFWRTARSVLVPSDAVGRMLAALGVDPGIVRNARVAVELDPPEPATVPEWADENGEVVGYVGRIEPDKGTLDLVRAAPGILARRPEARIVIVGGDDFGSDPAYARAVRDEAARTDRVVLAGPQPDAHRLMRYFDVLAFPSHREAGATAAAEALAAGVPVVGADTGGMAEVVLEGRTGRLVPVGDPAALADAVVQVLESPDRDEMGREARRHAELFSAERSADVVEGALLDALAANP